MNTTKIILVSALILPLVACEGTGQKQVGGTILGGAIGGVVGSQIGSGKGTLVAVGLGALLGAFAGSEVGKSLDKADQAYARQTAHHALETTPSGTKSTWHNPDSGNEGTITPVKTTQQADGRYCREFYQTVMIGGKEEQAYGTACRQPDGSWKMTEKK